MIELALRVVLSLAVVLGLLWMISRLTAKRLGGRRGGLVQVHARQPLGRSASVNIVTVGGKTLLIGVTENTVNLITELDADVVEQAAIAPVVSLVAAASQEADASNGESADDPADPADDAADDAAEDEPVATNAFAAVLAQVNASAKEQSVLRPVAPRPTAVPADGALAGSLLSLGTWKQTFAAVSGRSTSSR